MGLLDRIKRLFGGDRAEPEAAPAKTSAVTTASRSAAQSGVAPASKPPSRPGIPAPRPSTAERRIPAAPPLEPQSRLPVRQVTSRISRMTETRLINTAFGPAQIIDDGQAKMLRIRDIPEEFLAGLDTEEFGREGVVPFLEGRIVEGAYLFNAETVEIEERKIKDRISGAVTDTKRAFLLPVTASMPFFFLPPYHAEIVDRILAYQNGRGEQYALPATEDLTAQVVGKISRAALLWKDPGTRFDLPRFVSLIDTVKSQEGYTNLLQINLKGNIVYLLSIGRHIAGVFDLSPAFMHLNAARAVRIDYDGDQNTWLAPFGRKAAL